MAASGHCVCHDRKSPFITFLAISDQYGTFICFKFVHKMASGDHFAWPKITFDCISYHFRSIRNFNVLIKLPNWPPAAILDDRKSLSIEFFAISDQYAHFVVEFLSLSIAFLAISDQFATFIFLKIFSQNGCRRPFWMTENHFRLHFSPFQINTQLSFFLFFLTKWLPAENHFRSHFSSFQINTQLWFHKMAAGGHFGWPKITFDRISRHFRSIHNFFFKIATSGHFGCPIFANIDRDLPL